MMHKVQSNSLRLFLLLLFPRLSITNRFSHFLVQIVWQYCVEMFGEAIFGPSRRERDDLSKLYQPIVSERGISW